MKHHRLILKQDMLAAFQELGMQQGMTVMVHSSLSSLGYVCGGAQTVIRALLETVTREGTIVMATESWKNLDPDAGVHNEVGSDDGRLYATTGHHSISVLRRQTADEQ